MKTTVTPMVSQDKEDTEVPVSFEAHMGMTHKALGMGIDGGPHDPCQGSFVQVDASAAQSFESGFEKSYDLLMKQATKEGWWQPASWEESDSEKDLSDSTAPTTPTDGKGDTTTLKQADKESASKNNTEILESEKAKSEDIPVDSTQTDKKVKDAAVDKAAASLGGSRESEESDSQIVSSAYNSSTEDEYYAARLGPANLWGILPSEEPKGVIRENSEMERAQADEITQPKSDEASETKDVHSSRALDIEQQQSEEDELHSKKDAESLEKDAKALGKDAASLGKEETSSDEKTDMDNYEPKYIPLPSSAPFVLKRSVDIPKEKWNISDSTDESACSNNTNPMFHFTNGTSPQSPISLSADDASSSLPKEEYKPQRPQVRKAFLAKPTPNPNVLPPPMRPNATYSGPSFEDYGCAPAHPFASFLPADLPESVSQAFYSMFDYFNTRTNTLQTQNANLSQQCHELKADNISLSHHVNAAYSSNMEVRQHLEAVNNQNATNHQIMTGLSNDIGVLNHTLAHARAEIDLLKVKLVDGEKIVQGCQMETARALKKAEWCEEKLEAQDEWIKGIVEDVEVLNDRQTVTEKRLREAEAKKYRDVGKGEDRDVEALGFNRYVD